MRGSTGAACSCAPVAPETIARRIRAQPGRPIDIRRIEIVGGRVTETIGAPVARAQMLVRRPVAEVFEAFVDPAVTSRFWFSRGSGRLEAGKRVRWDWEMYGVFTHADVKTVEENRRILVEWNGPGNPSSVEWTFEARGDGQTFVSVRNWGFSGDADAVVAQAIDSTGGFTFLLAGLKAFLEHGIELDLVADHAPDALVAGWAERDRRA
jgi:uncharacterized protein YndB with AHSA1/START domain